MLAAWGHSLPRCHRAQTYPQPQHKHVSLLESDQGGLVVSLLQSPTRGLCPSKSLSTRGLLCESLLESDQGQGLVVSLPESDLDAQQRRHHLLVLVWSPSHLLASPHLSLTIAQPPATSQALG